MDRSAFIAMCAYIYMRRSGPLLLCASSLRSCNTIIRSPIGHNAVQPLNVSKLLLREIRGLFLSVVLDDVALSFLKILSYPYNSIFWNVRDARL